jgi:CubicO group peptidase (beta-lactamase class C family)
VTGLRLGCTARLIPTTAARVATVLLDTGTTRKAVDELRSSARTSDKGKPMPQRDAFAQEVRSSVEAGEISGAVAAVTTSQLLRIEAFGLKEQASKSPMETDTIFRVGSMAKTVHTAAALRLMEEGRFRLDDEISKWAPELADRRVVRTPTSGIDDTVPARRGITMFDVLTFQLGLGMYLGGHKSPQLEAMRAAGVAPFSELVPFGADEFMARLGSLPLAHQPGDAFMYHVGDDVLRVLLARIAGQPLGDVLRERVFEPLDMVDSGISVPATKRHRVSTCYWPRKDPARELEVWDEPDGRFASDPVFPNSLVSTAGDYVNFSKMLLDDGMFQDRKFLSRESVALMTTNHLGDEQKRRSPAAEGFWQTRGWGMGGTVYTRSIPHGPNGGSYSWFGGYGGHFLVDRQRGSAVILMVPRMVTGDKETALGYAFELSTYREILSPPEN